MLLYNSLNDITAILHGYPYFMANVVMVTYAFRVN